MTPDQAYYEARSLPPVRFGGLTLADAPLIKAEMLSEQPGRPLTNELRGEQQCA